MILLSSRSVDPQASQAHLLFSSLSPSCAVRWSSTSYSTHLHVLIGFISRNEHVPLTLTRQRVPHLQQPFTRLSTGIGKVLWLISKRQARPEESETELVLSFYSVLMRR